MSRAGRQTVASGHGGRRLRRAVSAGSHRAVRPLGGSRARRPAGPDHHRAGGARLSPELRDAWPGTGGWTTRSTPGRSPRRSAGCQRQIGPVERLVGALEQLQVPLAQVREALGIAGHGRATTALNVRDKSRMKAVLRRRGRAVRPAPAGHAAPRRRWLPGRGRASRWWPSRRPAPGRRPPTGSTTPTRFAAWLRAPPQADPAEAGCSRSSWSARSTRSTASPSAARPSGRRSRTTCRRRWRCCATRGSSGRCCCRARSTDPSTTAIQRGRAGRAAGARRARRVHPHGVVPPPGRLGRGLRGRRPAARRPDRLDARLRHDVDFYRVWAELVVLDRFDPPERRLRRRHRLPARPGPRPGPRGARRRRAAAPRSGTWSSRRKLPQPGQPASRRLRGRGLRHRARTPTPRWCGTRCDRIVAGIRVELVEASDGRR